MSNLILIDVHRLVKVEVDMHCILQFWLWLCDEALAVRDA